jgi:hypothetical protein
MENTGQIIRSKKTGKSRYTPISNDILQSLTLTAEEKSILVHLLSLPEDWMVYKINFGKSLNMGRHRFNNAWKGLVEKGYIVSIRMIDTNTNLMRGWNHMVHEEPVIQDVRIDQNTDLPKIGQSEERVIDKVITEQSNNLTKEQVYTFDYFWDLYKKRGVKSKGARAFAKLKPSEIELLKSFIPKYIDNHAKAGKIDYLPHFSTFLNDKRWNDELPYQIKIEQPVAIKQPKYFNIEDYDK